MTDIYVYFIIALLPLSACMLVLQVNPYHALVIRGVLGAIAAMVYAILGAADVSLTEALMGTMLAITLYAVAVRSSLVMRLGVIEEKEEENSHFQNLLTDLRKIFSKHYMRVELVPYRDREELHQALLDKEVHATCAQQLEQEEGEENHPYRTTIRLQRIYDIIRTELSSPETSLSYVNTTKLGEK